MTIVPPYLKKGDTIGIVASVRKVTAEEIKPAQQLFAHSGFDIKLSNNIFEEHNQYAGTDEQRAADFMQMILDDNVKAIICARGGYGSIRLVDFLDFDAIQRNPKWFCGYSDTTVIHTILNSMDIQSLHSTMPINFPPDGLLNISTASLIAALTGEKIAINASYNDLNIPGSVTGELVGGNLSLIYSLSGTPFQAKAKNKILFLEDLEEYLYHIDRMMINLALCGTLADVSAVVVGYMNNMNDNKVPFGKTAEEIIHEHVAKFGIPLAFGLPAGHLEPNYTLKFGAQYQLNISKNGTTLVEI